MCRRGIATFSSHVVIYRFTEKNWFFSRTSLFFGHWSNCLCLSLPPAILSGKPDSLRDFGGISMNSTIRNTVLVSVVTVGFGWNVVANAQDSGTFDATAEVAGVCEITAGNALAFGTYNPVAATAVSGTTTVSVTCADGTAGTEVGLAYTGSMSDGAATPNTLTYGLFQDAGHTTGWGDTVDVDRQAVTADGTAQVMTVFGNIDSGQTTAPVGLYSETVTATVYF